MVIYFERIVGNPNFSDHYKKAGYNMDIMHIMDIMRQSKCLV